MTTIYRFHDCRVDAQARELRRGEQRIAVAPGVFALLMYLLAQRHRVVTKQELLHAVWRGADVSDSVIHRAVVKLREAIGDNGRTGRLLRTVHRVGYQFVAEVTEQAAGPAARVAGSVDALPTPAAAEAAGRPRVPRPVPPRLVLLPLDNQSGEARHEWACWGVPRLVCEALLGDPRVAAVDMDQVRHGLASLPPGGAYPAAVAALLGARWVVTGRLLPDASPACGLEVEVHGGVAGSSRLSAADPTGLAGPLARLIGELAGPADGWLVRPLSDDPLALQALARAQDLVARAEWAAAAHLLKVVLDIEPDNASARLLWLRTLPQLHDTSATQEGERLLAQARRSGDQRLQAATHEVLGRTWFHRRGADWATMAQRHLGQALALAGPWAHEDWVLRIHLNLGFAQQLQRNHASARTHYEITLRRLAHGGNALYRVAALNNRALIECFQEQPLVACDLAAQALSLCEQHGLLHAGLTSRATLSLAQAELGWLGQATRHSFDNLRALAGQTHQDPESAAWALLVAAQVGLLMNDGPALATALAAARPDVAPSSPRVALLLAAFDVLWPLLNDAEPHEQVAAEGLLDCIRQSEEGGFREHSHHLATLALELALRARSPRLLVRLRDTLRTLDTAPQDAGLTRALQRAEAAECLWRGEPEAALQALRAACAGAPAGRLQAWARLDLAWLLMSEGEALEAEQQIAWVRPWLEAWPAGLCLHARSLALRGEHEAAADAQLAAMRLRGPAAPAGWHTAYLAHAAGRVPEPGVGSSLLTLW